MTNEQFLELNNRYRVVAEFSDDLECVNKESVFIPCLASRGMIYAKDENTNVVLSFQSPNAYVEKLQQRGLSIESFGELGEYYVEFNDDIFDEVAKEFKAKKQAQRPIPPHSVRNITTFLRVMQNVHPRYKDQLEKYIADNRDLEE